MRSIIYLADKTANVARKFGADPYYYNATLVHADGRRELLRFTEEQLQAARDRGAHDADGAEPRRPWWLRWLS